MRVNWSRSAAQRPHLINNSWGGGGGDGRNCYDGPCGHGYGISGNCNGTIMGAIRNMNSARVIQ